MARRLSPAHALQVRSLAPTVPVPGVGAVQVPTHTRVIPGARIDLRAAAAADGTFEGLALPWDTEDSYGTRFAPGTFSAGGLDQEGRYALLWMHDPWTVLGTFGAQEREDGLWIVDGRYDDTDEGRAARERARSGSAPELSVGFTPYGVDPEDEQRFVSAGLNEVSQITLRFAAVPGAGLTTVRSSEAAERRRGQARARLGIALTGR